jgi:hypothetical protein
VEADMSLAAQLIEAPFGLRKRKVDRLTQQDVWVSYKGESHSLSMEIAYACGFLNSWPRETVKALGTIRLMADMQNVDFSDRCNAIEACANEWGASRFLSYKIATLKSYQTGGDPNSPLLNKIDQVLKHSESPGIQYSALENILPTISMFQVARRYTNIFKGKHGSSFRTQHHLNNLVATPFSEEDAADYVRRNVETSLVDTVYALWVLINLRSRLPSGFDSIRRNLDKSLLIEFEESVGHVSQIKAPDLLLHEFEGDAEGPDASLNLYRLSAAYLEFPDFCRFRNDLDRVIGVRLVSPLILKPLRWPAEDLPDKGALRRNAGQFSLSHHDTGDGEIDTFYRTYLFLRFIQDPMNLAYLDEADIIFLFDQTVALDYLLLERELQVMHLNASDSTRPLVTILALALYRSRSSDPDIDYDYRLKLEDYILERCGGSISTFIEEIAQAAPQIANYLVNSLDEPTIEKMYRLISSPKEASDARREILLAAGFAQNRIEYIIEAEAIETRGKVAKLRQYFDSSRMFVDSIALRDWLEANPSAYMQQYKEILPKLIARLTAVASIKDEESGTSRKVPILTISSTMRELVEKIAVESFREFCVNNEFGIESYLGRRIRHNTLHGVMTNPIDAILSKPSHRPIIERTSFGRALADWEGQYRLYIDKMRKEYLQFKVKGPSNAMFDSDLDLSDKSAQRAITQLSETIFVAGADLLTDQIIAFCWQQIAPQLDEAARRIKVQMAGDVKKTLDLCLSDFNSPAELRVFSELVQGVDEVFSKVAGWFRRPDTGFIPATIMDICRIIDLEAGRSEMPTIVRGNALGMQYTGISVHRLYDCLAVLINNAIEHGEFYSEVYINCNSSEIPGTNLHMVEVSALSSVDESEVSGSLARIEKALSSVETGKDMVTEGFSGLKKLKYITKLNNDGVHTVSYSTYGSQIEIGFSLKVEVQTSMKGGNESSPD